MAAGQALVVARTCGLSFTRINIPIRAGEPVGAAQGKYCGTTFPYCSQSLCCPPHAVDIGEGLGSRAHGNGQNFATKALPLLSGYVPSPPPRVDTIRGLGLRGGVSQRGCG